MYIGNLQATFASPDAEPTIRTANSKAITLTGAPGAHGRPLILEEEIGLRPAPKEAVPVLFICNLRGSGCPLSADTILPSQWYIDCKLAKDERELVLSQRVCTTQEPGQAMGSTPLETPTVA